MLNKLSKYLSETDISGVSAIDTTVTVGFLEKVASGGSSQILLYSTASRLRRFTAWLGAEDYIDHQITSLVPKVKPPQKKIPDVYSNEEICMMLGAIDTASATGRRDLIVCLLAARLGMRSQDIAYLTFESLCWKENLIKFTAMKTGKLTVLPLTNEIGEAIIAYIRNGRPEGAESRYMLLRHEKPNVRIRPALVHTIVCGALNRAGIARDGRRRGGHALRASLATRMLKNDIPLPVISEALSHTNSDSTKLYMKVDIDKLRSCALDVSPLVNTWWKVRGKR
jgi:site-specific recombinase XerD